MFKVELHIWNEETLRYDITILDNRHRHAGMIEIPSNVYLDDVALYEHLETLVIFCNQRKKVG